jgi:hypothetical protein
MEIPLSLPIGPCWELEERPVDSTKFLQILPASFPEATAIFFEGSSIAPDVVEIFEQYAEDAPYLPKPQTLWSTGRILRFRCRFMPILCETLAKSLRHHAEPELFDHIFLYADRLPLLEWPDAFSNCIWIASSVPESRVSAFAANLNLSYKYLNSC